MSLCSRNSIIHEIFSEFLQPFRHVRIQRVAPFCRVVFVFIWFWIFGWLSRRVPRSVRSTCELDTGAGWESIPLRSSRARISLSFDTVVVGEVDELEEDVG